LGNYEPSKQIFKDYLTAKALDFFTLIKNHSLKKDISLMFIVNILLSLLFLNILTAETWIDQSVDQEFKSISPKITKRQIGNTWAKCQKSKLPFYRFRIIKGEIHGPESQIKDLLCAIGMKYPLPNVDFIYYNHDILDESWFEKNVQYAPIFTSAKKSGSTHTLLFMDWYYHVNATNPGSLNHTIEEVSTQSSKLPWELREDKVFWRGANTDGYYTLKNWKDIPRGKLIAFSKRHPHLVDAGFTAYHPWNTSNICLFEKKVGLSPFVLPKEQVRYKYLIDLDGTTPTFPSLHWKLFSGSLIFKQHPHPKGILWYTRHLVPWVHFVPLNPDLSDLEEKLNWAFTHQQESKKIAENGQEFAMTHLTKEQILLYCYKMLLRYASLQDF
jgi:hypothetical protein